MQERVFTGANLQAWIAPFCQLQDIIDRERRLKYHEVFTEETLDIGTNDIDLSIKCKVEEAEFGRAKVWKCIIFKHILKLFNWIRKERIIHRYIRFNLK